MQAKLWSGVFNQNTNQLVEAFNASILFDYVLAKQDILGSMAHVEMLAECGYLSVDEKSTIQAGLRNLAYKIENHQIEFSIADEDIHMNIERLLSEEIGAAAEKIHTARSRNDQVACDLHLFVREKILIIMDFLLEFQKTLLNLAKEHQQTILPAYTHLQRAQPIVLSQYFLAYAAMLQRDSARLMDCWQRTNISPLGACALAGTTLNVNKNRTAELLGFDQIYHNTLDAVSDRDFMIEFCSAAAMIMMHLSRFSEDLILWSTQEFGFISFDDAFVTGSSIMPQKKNPDVLELGRGKTGSVYGALMALLTMMKGLPMAYNKDLQEDKEPLFKVIKTLEQIFPVYNALLKAMTIHKNNMMVAVEKGFLNATALADYLVQKGIPFREAHRLVGKMVANCMQRGCSLESMTLEEMQIFCETISESVYEALSISKIVALSQAAQVKEWVISKDQMEEQRGWVIDKQQRMQEIYQRFDLKGVF
jgi:argininosuccinate lyase